MIEQSGPFHTEGQPCKIIPGDALRELSKLDSSLFQACITSPPYWGLRDYGIPGQIGAEETLDEYIERLVAVFRQVRRVLAEDGTLWLNIGDSYTSGNRTWRATDKKNAARAMSYRPPTPESLKPKDLIGIPWRVAFALQANGWYLRSDIIWHKPNCQPESVKDRPTQAHEYLFLFSKAEKYYYNHEAIKEPAKAGGKRRNRRSVWSVNTEGFDGAHFACVDDETECLTIEGWKRQDELDPGILAAQFDRATGKLSWAPIQKMARYDVHKENMVVAQNRNVTMVLTPNHRTLISRRHSKTRKYQPLQIIRADELKPSHAIPISAEWIEEDEEPISPDWAELIGWYIAEGCETSHSWAVEIYQSRSANPEKVARIRDLLNAVGAEFTEAQATRIWKGQETNTVAFQVRGFAATFLRQWSPGKKIPQCVLHWSNRLLTRLLKGLIDGDGHRRGDGRFSLIQRSKDVADMAQAIGVRLGYAVMVSRRSKGTFTVYFTRKHLLSFRGTAGEGAHIEQEPYAGIVWCPKLPAGTWVARRNGRAFITGNTFPTALVKPCILAGSQPGSLVLDPFFGSGTVGEVCLETGRRCVGIEIKPEYAEIARRRISGVTLSLAL